MQFSVHNKVGFFVNKLYPKQKDISIKDIRCAFKDTSDKAKQIVNSIT
jgi:hypothetical protein